MLILLAALIRNVSDLYLTKPPSDAPHKPVPPEKIVIAGDSAGAGLCVALLTVLRDLGVAQPAGAVLISPWVDLTHSFPSIMSNTSSVSCARQFLSGLGQYLSSGYHTASRFHT